jgi:hypothetical protein
MLNISNFFSRFKNRELYEMMFRAAVIDSVKETLKFDLDPMLVSYSNNMVFLKISPAAKSAVLLKKKELLEKIKEKTKREGADIK